MFQIYQYDFGNQLSLYTNATWQLFAYDGVAPTCIEDAMLIFDAENNPHTAYEKALAVCPLTKVIDTTGRVRWNYKPAEVEGISVHHRKIDDNNYALNPDNIIIPEAIQRNGSMAQGNDTLRYFDASYYNTLMAPYPYNDGQFITYEYSEAVTMKAVGVFNGNPNYRYNTDSFIVEYLNGEGTWIQCYSGNPSYAADGKNIKAFTSEVTSTKFRFRSVSAYSTYPTYFNCIELISSLPSTKADVAPTWALILPISFTSDLTRLTPETLGKHPVIFADLKLSGEGGGITLSKNNYSGGEMVIPLGMNLRNKIWDSVPVDIIAPSIIAPSTRNIAAYDINGTPSSDLEFLEFLGEVSATDNYDCHLDIVHDAPSLLPFGDTVVTFSATDYKGNTGTGSTIVTVKDMRPPVVSTIGATTLALESGTPYVDQGATAFDDIDGDVSGSIVVVGAELVDHTTLGVYVVTYNCTDAAGNVGTINRTITVEDSLSPDISFIPSDITVAATDATGVVNSVQPIIDFLATPSALDINDGVTQVLNDCPAQLPLGATLVTFSSTDGEGNTAIASATINVTDLTAPVITPIGNSIVSTEFNSVYVDQGATAFDNVDGDVTASLIESSTVDTSLLGSYIVEWSVQDAVGNTSAVFQRTVNVVDTTAPIINLLGDETVTHTFGDVYTDLGVNATDLHDGDLTSNVVTVNPVNENVVGSYSVTYNVSDSSGNAATEVVRTVNVVDSVIPVITLLGNVTENVQAGSFIDAGATATDNVDGDISGSIIVTGSVNDSVLGQYLLNYNVTDSNGNVALQVVRTVNILDTTAPVISLIGNSTVSTAHGSPYVDQGATAVDNLDGDVSGSIVSATNVDTNAVGTYQVTYNVTDSEGNIGGEVIRTVNVVDVTAPVISIIGSDVTIQHGDVYVDQGATALDAVDGDVTSSIVTVNNVNVNAVGVYTVTYNVVDLATNAATQVVRNVTVEDNVAPTITIIGENIVQEFGSSYVDQGATAFDNADGDITGNISAVSTVDINVLGSYTVTYNVSDSSGNAATEVVRTVNVVDTTAPIITLVGNASIAVEVDSVYTDQGATAADEVDGNLNAFIVPTSDVNANVIGVYTVSYNVSDSSGNAATEVVRTVNVVDSLAPVITLLGNSTITQEFGVAYVDQGVTCSDAAEGDLTGSVITVNPVNTSVIGTYNVTYNITDASGNVATEVVRIVTIEDSSIPVISIIGGDETIVKGNVYNDLGATASDLYDGDITGAIVTNNLVDTSFAGLFTVTYDVVDSSGNVALQVVRNVEVTEV